MSETSENSTSYTPLQSVKRYFFAMRNGIIADTLRKGGSPFHYIFGLNLPQLVDAAGMFGKDRELAEKLWANNTTRESMLLAPMLMPYDSFSEEDARKWMSEVPAPEVADILCHRLLRHLPFAGQLASDFSKDTCSDMERYTAGRLALNMFDNPDFDAREILSELQKNPGRNTAAIARQLAMRFEEF